MSDLPELNEDAILSLEKDVEDLKNWQKVVQSEMGKESFEVAQKCMDRFEQLENDLKNKIDINPFQSNILENEHKIIKLEEKLNTHLDHFHGDLHYKHHEMLQSVLKEGFDTLKDMVSCFMGISKLIKTVKPEVFVDWLHTFIRLTEKLSEKENSTALQPKDSLTKFRDKILEKFDSKSKDDDDYMIICKNCGIKQPVYSIVYKLCQDCKKQKKELIAEFLGDLQCLNNTVESLLLIEYIKKWEAKLT